MRIEGVRDNNQLAQNIQTFKYSVNEVRIVPVTGLVFGIVLGLLFLGKLISGAIFPVNEGKQSLDALPEIAKWLIWAFIEGFSERLVPDMVDRLAEKAQKAETH